MIAHYLHAWFPIIASTWTDTGATYVDAFAGPGEYANGGHGSPVIALRAASRSDVLRHGTELRLVFVEQDRRRIEHLKAVIDSLALGSAEGTRLVYVNGPCERDLGAALDALGTSRGPVFANFDGWGVDTPYALVQRVGQGKAAEVFVTFQAQWFSRFASVSDVAAGDSVFGETGWRAVAELPTEQKRAFLVDRYRERLGAAGFPQTLVFEMVDEGGHELLLIFGTANERGVEKMKDAMWAVDKVAGQRFRDPRDVNQMTFQAMNDSPDLSLLKRQILDRLAGGPQSLAALKIYALRETLFKQSHVDPAVRSLEADHRVRRSSARRHEDVLVDLASPSLF